MCIGTLISTWILDFQLLWITLEIWWCWFTLVSTSTSSTLKTSSTFTASFGKYPKSFPFYTKYKRNENIWTSVISMVGACIHARKVWIDTKFIGLLPNPFIMFGQKTGLFFLHRSVPFASSDSKGKYINPYYYFLY